MSQLSEAKQQQKNQWHAAAGGWDRYDDWFQLQTADLTAWMVEAARIRPGSAVLDLACGAGQPALSAAKAALPGGRVVATDIAPEMVAVTRRKAAGAGVTNIEVREMDAENIDLPNDSFDALTCRFGIMFCPEPERAAAEFHRVLKPGGRFALSVWDVPAKNTFVTTASVPVAQATGAAPADPNAPGLFRLADPAKVAGLLRDAGFREVTVEARPMTWRWDSAEDYFAKMSELVAPLKAALASLPAEAAAKLRETIVGALKAEQGSGPVALQAVPLCATGVK